MSEKYKKEMKRMYPDAEELIDESAPKGLVEEMEITIFVDSDYAHDLVTRRSIGGVICFVGKTPVYWKSVRQGQVEGSTYGAEFTAMKKAIEVAESVRYSLRNFGVKVSKATKIFGDNQGVITSSSDPDSGLKKKHVAVAYHMAREAVAAGVGEIIKVEGKNNLADALTKALPNVTNCYLCDQFLGTGNFNGDDNG